MIKRLWWTKMLDELDELFFHVSVKVPTFLAISHRIFKPICAKSGKSMWNIFLTVKFSGIFPPGTRMSLLIWLFSLVEITLTLIFFILFSNRLLIFRILYKVIACDDTKRFDWLIDWLIKSILKHERLGFLIHRF